MPSSRRRIALTVLVATALVAALAVGWVTASSCAEPPFDESAYVDGFTLDRGPTEWNAPAQVALAENRSVALRYGSTWRVFDTADPAVTPIEADLTSGVTYATEEGTVRIRSASGP